MMQETELLKIYKNQVHVSWIFVCLFFPGSFTKYLLNSPLRHCKASGPEVYPSCVACVELYFVIYSGRFLIIRGFILPAPETQQVRSVSSRQSGSTFENLCHSSLHGLCVLPEFWYIPFF